MYWKAGKVESLRRVVSLGSRERVILWTLLFKQSRTVWFLPVFPLTTFSAFLLLVEDFSQRISLIREVRDSETKENRQRRLNYNNVVITHCEDN